MKKESLINFFRTTWELTSELIVFSFRYVIDTYKLSDPCETCITRPCCNDDKAFSCMDKRKYAKDLDGYKSPLWKKMFFTLYLCWVFVFIAGMFTLLTS